MKIQSLYLLVIISLALAVGIFYAGPQFLIGQELARTGYRYIASPFVDDLANGGDSYFQFARQIYEGRFPPGDLFSGSDQQLPNIYPWLPPLLLGGLIAIFKDVSLAYLAANFVFSVVLFFLFYALGLAILKKNKLWSLLLGLVGVLTPLAGNASEMFFSPANFGNIFLKNFYPAVKTYLPLLFLSRVDHPLLTYPAYLAAILCLVLFWYKPTRLRAIAAGVSAALLFYTYFHMWAYWVVVLGVLFVLSLLFFRQDKSRQKGFIILGVVATLAAVPYFVNFFQFRSWPGSQDLIQRLGVELGRSFNVEVWRYYLVYVIAGVLVWRLFGRVNIYKTVLYFSFLLAAVIVWNVQVVTGFVPHSDHWPRAINPLVFLIAFDLAFILVQNFLTRWPAVKGVASGLVVLALVLLMAKKFVNLTVFISPPPVLSRHVLPQDALFSFDWLEKYNPQRTIISPSFLTSIYLAGFTSARPYLPWGGVTPLDNLELENRFLTANKLFGVSATTLESRLRDGMGLVCRENCSRPYVDYNISGTRTALYQLYFEGGPKGRAIPDEKINELTDAYNDLSADWLQAESDWVYLGLWERQFDPVLNQNNNLSLAYQNSSVQIYKIIK